MPKPVTNLTVPNLPANIDSIKGFLAEDEAHCLYRYALEESPKGAVLEVGSYCGKSTIYLGLAAQLHNGTVYALDHHRGSEEHQKGEFFHDSDLFDQQSGQMDTFREFRRNIANAELNDTVVPVVASSAIAARHWQTPLSMVFIDGGHSLEAALTDYRCWTRHLIQGGILCIHDVFHDAFDGGQAPRAIFQMACDSGLFEFLEQVDSLVVLRRL